jgi:hypothetical protein
MMPHPPRHHFRQPCWIRLQGNAERCDAIPGELVNKGFFHSAYTVRDRALEKSPHAPPRCATREQCAHTHTALEGVKPVQKEWIIAWIIVACGRCAGCCRRPCRRLGTLVAVARRTHCTTPCGCTAGRRSWVDFSRSEGRASVPSQASARAAVRPLQRRPPRAPRCRWGRRQDLQQPRTLLVPGVVACPRRGGRPRLGP